MNRASMRTLGLVLSLALAAAACNRNDSATSGSQSADTASSGPRNRAIAENPGASPGIGNTAPSASGSSSAASAAPGASSSTPTPPSSGPVAGADRAFMADAANTGMAEVEAGRMVAGKTTNETVKSYARQMERDHTSAGDELKRIASMKGVDLPTAVDGEPRTQLTQMNSLPPGELERTFLQQFGIDAHQRAISLFERQAREGQDPDLKAFAERTLLKLREHLALAQQMQGGQAGQPAR